MRLSAFTLGLVACLLAVVAAWSKEGAFLPVADRCRIHVS